MDSDPMIKSIFHCLGILVAENKSDQSSSKSKAEAFITDLKKNIDLVIEELPKHPLLKQLLSAYIEQQSFSTSTSQIIWNFLELCLVLIKLLSDALTAQENDYASNQKFKTPHPASGLLSVAQQKTFKKCLEFISALGFSQNLIPGVGIPLRNKTEFASIMESLDVEQCPRTKYYQLIACLVTLLDCVKQRTLQNIILSYHTGDLLAALSLLCYAPIKKMKQNEHCPKNGKMDLLSSSVFESSSCAMGHQAPVVLKPKTLDVMLIKLKDFGNYTEEELIKETWEDRLYFIPQFEKLLNQICPSVLMRELLLLQGTPMKPMKDLKNSQTKVPLWLRRMSNRLLTQQILQPCGVKTFIQTVLDKMSDADLKAGTVDKSKIEAVSRLISCNPVKHISMESYMEQISLQVLDLIHTKDSGMEIIFTCIASCVMLQFLDRHFELTEKYFFSIIFLPLWSCLRNSDTSLFMESDIVGKEEDITLCIEDAHKIFVINRCPSSEKAVKLLVPFYHLLFLMFVKLQNGISFLRIKIRDLLTTILNQFRSDEAVTLLRFAAFEDISFPPIELASNLRFCFGDSGGIVVSKNTQENTEDIFEDISKKSQAVNDILHEVTDKKLKVPFFLYLLKKLSNSSEANDSGHTKGKDEVVIFKDNLTMLQILQELSETVGEDLVDDIIEASEFFKITLERGASAKTDDEGQLFGNETVMMCLVILSTLTGYKDQLTSAQWKAMKKCLPSLEKVVSNTDDPILKSMAEDVRVTIATHGAVSSTQAKEKTFDTKVQQHKNRNKIPSQKMPENSARISNTCKNVTHIESKTSNTNIKEIATNKDLSFSEMTKSLKNNDSKDIDFHNLNLNPNLEELKQSTMVSSNVEEKDTAYKCALNDLKDPILPIRGHGLIVLCKLLAKKDRETLSHKEELLKVFQENLSDEDSYIYLSAIRGLSLLADVSVQLVLPVLLSEFQNSKSHKSDLQLKIGEVLIKICRNLGEMTAKFRDQFLHAYLIGTRHDEPQIRISSLSNLGEVCKKLKFALGPWLQEILLCVKSLLKTDPDLEVRRSAMLVITLILQGTGKDTFKILENDIKELYSQLRWIYRNEKDDVLKLHAQLALDEVNSIVKEYFFSKPPLIKEIRVLDPFV